MNRHVFVRLRDGLVKAIPVLIVLAVILTLLSYTNELGRLVVRITGLPRLAGVIEVVIGFVGVIVLLYLFSYIPRKWFSLLFRALPVVGPLFRVGNDLSEILRQEHLVFVFVPWPDPVHRVGIITNTFTHQGEIWHVVALPNSPLPWNGFTCFVRAKDVEILEMTPQEFVKLHMTFGRALPASLLHEKAPQG